MGGCSWAGWVTVAMIARPDKSEVRHLINVEAPYIRDQSKIESALSQVAEDRKALVNVIQANTEAITSLKVQIAALEATLKQ